MGRVFVDANTKKTFDGGDWALPFISVVNGDLPWTQTTGLAAAQVLSDEEGRLW